MSSRSCRTVVSRSGSALVRFALRASQSGSAARIPRRRAIPRSAGEVRPREETLRRARDSRHTACTPSLHGPAHRLSPAFGGRFRRLRLRRRRAAPPQAAPSASPARSPRVFGRPALMPLAKIAGAAAVAVVGLVTGFGVTRSSEPGTAPAAREQTAVPPTQSGVLSQLGLDDEQREKIAEVSARERERVETLERALDANEHELRLAELATPFDAERVNDLVENQAELTAYLRGTESRVMSEIAALLTPEQRQRFAALRARDGAESSSTGHREATPLEPEP